VCLCVCVCVNTTVAVIAVRSFVYPMAIFIFTRFQFARGFSPLTIVKLSNKLQKKKHI